MRITTFSNNRIFGPGAAQTKGGQSRNIVADMARTVQENAQTSLQTTAEQQAAISKQDKLELSVKESVKSPAQYSTDIYQALTGTDNKQEFEKQLEAQAVKAMQEALQEQAESAKDQVEAAKKAMDYMLKMLEIARRISTGGQVPGADEQKLLEYSQVLYTMAKMLSMQAEEHEKYDTLFEDEEQSGAAAGGVEAAEAAAAGGSAEAPAASGAAASAAAAPVE